MGSIYIPINNFSFINNTHMKNVLQNVKYTKLRKENNVLMRQMRAFFNKSNFDAVFDTTRRREPSTFFQLWRIFGFNIWNKLKSCFPQVCGAEWQHIYCQCRKFGKFAVLKVQVCENSSFESLDSSAISSWALYEPFIAQID